MNRPATLKFGSVVFRTFPTRDGRVGFRYKSGSVWKTKVRSALADLKSDAETIARGILNAETAALDVTAEERRIYVSARELLEPYGMQVDAVARDVVEAFKIMPGVPLRDMAAFYKRNQTTALIVKTVSQVIKAMLDEKEEQDLSGRRKRDLRNDCKRIEDAFGPRNISEVTAEELLEFIRCTQRERGFAWKRRNHLRDMVVCVWRYAKSKAWLPSDRVTAAEAVQRLPDPRTPRKLDTYTAPEMQAWIANIKPQFLPWLLICGFSPIRSEEVAPDPYTNKDPLRWEDFNWAKRYITIRPETAKVRGEDRIVPITDQLFAFLEPWHDKTGLVNPGEQPSKRETSRLSKITGSEIDGRWVQLTWRPNALRKTWISAMLAMCDDKGNKLWSRAHVAELAGTSEAKIRSNYKRPMDPDLAAAWFALRPKMPANVTQIRLFA
jgi:integrase